MKNTPKREERIIIDCLQIQGYDKISYQPDGNIPPDILLNNNIAIEVRRLNQNQVSGDKFEGLEQDEYIVHGLLKKIIEEVSDKTFNKSAFVGYFFGRPLPAMVRKELGCDFSKVIQISDFGMIFCG
ncbi:MAG: hypothetical protein RMJ33_08300, partial [Saprospiraceae bacterium]|nr:hypothetical protein [Saprospiraceae bacterium]